MQGLDLGVWSDHGGVALLERHMSDLLNAVRRVSENAHAPYSYFKVVAATWVEDETVFVDCSAHNLTCPEGTRADASAIEAMVAAGQTKVAEVAVIADEPVLVMPSGGCRQYQAGFLGAYAKATTATLAGRSQQVSVTDLSPRAFDTKQFLEM